MNSRLCTATCVALLLAATSARAQFSIPAPVPGEDFHVEVGAMLWSPDPGLVIGNGALNAVAPGGVDFVREFGLEATRFTEYRAVLKAGKHKFRFARIPIHYEAATALQRTVTFGGRTFDVSANATTDVTWNLLRAGYEYDFVQRPRGLLGFVAEVKHNTVTADVRATSLAGNVSSLSDVTAPIPTLGVIARAYPAKSLGVTFEYTGFKTPGFVRDRLSDVANFDATFKDLDIYATLSLSRFIGLQGGYRRISTDYVVDDDFGDLQLKGGYVGALVRF